MKITDVTPKVDRTFALELSALELQSIVLAVGMTSQHDRVGRADARGVEILGSREFFELYNKLDEAVTQGVKA